MSNFAQPVFAWTLGPTELIVILLILLLLFGGSKLPSLAKGLGQSLKEFKKASKEIDEEPKSNGNEKKPENATSSHGTN